MVLHELLKNTMVTFDQNSRKKDFSHEISDQRNDENSVSRKPEKLHSGRSVNQTKLLLFDNSGDSRSDVELVDETHEAGSENFVSAGEQNICDVSDKDLSLTRLLARATVVVERIETDRTWAETIRNKVSRKNSQKCGFFFIKN